MRTDNHETERDLLRNRWRIIRNERLALKKSLAAAGKSINEIRHNREYKNLKKEQRSLSKMIRHIEKIITA